MGKSYYISASTGRIALMGNNAFLRIPFCIVLWLIYINVFTEMPHLYRMLIQRLTNRVILSCRGYDHWSMNRSQIYVLYPMFHPDGRNVYCMKHEYMI